MKTNIKIYTDHKNFLGFEVFEGFVTWCEDGSQFATNGMQSNNSLKCWVLRDKEWVESWKSIDFADIMTLINDYWESKSEACFPKLKRAISGAQPFVEPCVLEILDENGSKLATIHPTIRSGEYYLNGISGLRQVTIQRKY